MADLLVTGGRMLSGTICPSGNKNSILPILCATLMTDKRVILRNVPNITDVEKLVDFMKSIGSKIRWNRKSSTLSVLNDSLDETAAQEGFPLGMFGAVLLLGPLASRFRKVIVKTKVKGCSLGMRPLDPHFIVMEKFGANIERNKDTVITFPHLRGTLCWTDHQSVTATENAVMLAVLAEGTTELVNAACEPHVQELCGFLVALGAQIDGIGSNRLHIEGVKELTGGEWTVSSDMHEITTFLSMGAMTGGEVHVKDHVPEHFSLIADTFAKLGVVIDQEGDSVCVKPGQSFEIRRSYTGNVIPKIEAAPWPYFPVDLLPLVIALSLKTRGEILFWNKIDYEWGLFWISELVKLGAKILMCDQYRILVMGPAELKGTTVQCPDIIRATVALVMASMAAVGESHLRNVDMIFRAHPDFFGKLVELGAVVRVVEEV